jgi:predicted ATPase
MPVHDPDPIFSPGVPAGGLVGRSADVAAVQRMMGRSRLVTVTGLPGVGKTAVAMAAAAAMSESHPSDACLVTLDSLRAEDLLPDTIADALKVPDAVTGRRLEALVSELRYRRLLLLLDTCEHLARACSDLAMTLLLHCPEVRILATSRESLRVPGGLTVTIGPLPLPQAVALFGRRAAEASPGFRVTTERRPVVEMICRRLDRLPLGIELAARQLASGPVEELSVRLQADYWFLRDSAASPARHESLCTAIGWSHRMCTPAERLAWARLSVFTGSFGLSDAQAVCADGQLPDADIAAASAALAARSLMVLDVHSGTDTRYRLPSIVRAYGALMLARLGGDAGLQRRHSDWVHVHRGVHGRDTKHDC